MISIYRILLVLPADNSRTQDIQMVSPDVAKLLD